MKLTKQQEAEVMPIYKEWWHSYMNGDVKTYDHYLDDDFRFVGSTDAEDYLNKRDTTQFFGATAKQLAGKSQLRNSILTSEYYDGVVFITEMADAYLLFGKEWTFYGKFRFSSMLRKNSDGWRFIYQHFSVPDSKAQEGETVGLEQVSKENQELRDAIKRRTFELEEKNRELEIEATLEKVRAKAMAMHNSNDLKEVVITLFEQLSRLNFNVSRCGIGILNKENRTGHAWATAITDDKVAVQISGEESFDDHPLLQGAFDAWIQQKTNFSYLLEGKDLINYYKSLELTTPMPLTAGIDRQYYYASLFSAGGLFAFQETEFSEEAKNILNRFANVLNLTYNRFLDLQKAEKQTREAQIEAAVERVRAQSMAMHHPDDLDKVNKEILSQLTWLQIDGLTGVSFYLIDENGWVKAWDFSSPGNLGDLSSYTLQFDSNKHEMLGFPFKTLLQTDLDYFVADYPLEKLEKAVYEVEEIDPAIAKIFREALSTGILTHQWTACCRISNGLLGIDLVSPPTENTKAIVLKMAGAFNQAYTRFLDLQKAEAQAKEAQIETALERVRARTMGMQQSEELLDVITVVSEQLQQLNFRFDHVSFANNEIDKDYRFWTSAKGLNPVRFNVPYIDIPIFTQLRKAQESGVKFYTDIVTKKENREWHKHLLKHGGSEVFTKDMNKYMMSRGMARSIAIHPNIILILGNYASASYSDEDNQVIARFGKVFEQSYTRFLDLKKAEAQTREAKIELSLERIRARVTSMQESSDLLDIVVTMRNEFVNLGHEAQYFWHMRWLPDTYQKAMTSGDGTRIGMIMNLPRHIHGDLQPVANWEKSAEPSYVLAMDVDAAVDYIGKMINLGDFEMVDPQSPSLDDIRHIGGLTFVMARTTHGEIGYSLPGVVTEPPKKAVDTLVRFAGVFDLAYKRFEDLKKAEKDLVEIKEARIKAETALVELKATQSQLIQSEKMASLGELTAGIAHEIQNPLNFVNNFSEVSSELVEEIKESRSKSQALRQYTGKEARSEEDELEDEILEDIKQNLIKINHHGKRADAIVKGMLAHSRSSSGEKVPTDLNALADEYLRLSYHGLRAKDKSFNADFSTDFDPGIPKVNVIPQDIGRVLLNLINNAFQAVHDVENPKVIVSTKQLERTIQVSVSDNGPGIPDNIKDKIFQPFFTTKPTGQGTGLGLSLSYDIVKAHGGDIIAESSVGNTKFTVTFPC